MTKARDLANASTALSAVTATELAFIDGVTSAVQTQIDGKQAINANVSTTELGYLDGVTSAIQTQLDAKIAKTLTTTTGDIIYASGANTPARLGIGSSAQVLTVSGGVPVWATAASGSTFSGCRLTLSSDVTTTNAVEKTLDFGVETFDTDSYHSTSSNTNRITIPTGKTGYYRYSSIVEWTTANSNGRRLAVFRKNGTAVQGFEYTPSASATLLMFGSNVQYLTAGDYIDLYVLNTSGSNITIGAGSTYFDIVYLGA